MCGVSREEVAGAEGPRLSPKDLKPDTKLCFWSIFVALSMSSALVVLSPVKTNRYSALPISLGLNRSPLRPEGHKRTNNARKEIFS